tara:strand:- start:37 stop:1383 length:1347 start_codon:yes stop_codon:yes gene_type:complete
MPLTKVKSDGLDLDKGIQLKEMSSEPSTVSGYQKAYALTNSGGNDSYTKLLIQSNTTNGSTTFVDSSGSEHSIGITGIASITNNVSHKVAQNKFGATSIYFDGSDYLTLPATNSDFAYSSEDFTIDFWMYPTSATFSRTVAQQTNGGMFCNIWYHRTNAGQSTANVSFILSDGTNTVEITTNDNTVPLNEWSHIAAVRDGSNIRLYVDGVHQLAGDVSSLGAIVSGTYHYIGQYWNTGGGEGYTGYLDEIRISRGIARWTGTGSFTPPSASYYKGAKGLNIKTDELYVQGGDVAFDTGKGIRFDGDTLDDYEEGTFSPTFTSSGGTMNESYSRQIGHYTKIGNIVSLSGELLLSAVGSPTGLAKLASFPFAATASSGYACSGAVGGNTNNWGTTVGAPTAITVDASQTSGVLWVYDNDAGNIGSWPLTNATDLASGSSLTFQVTYTTA